MPNYRGVLLEGTLIDSNDARAFAWIEAFEEHGHKVSYERVRRAVGMSSDHLVFHILGLPKNSPETKLLSKRHREIFRMGYLEQGPPLPGVQELM